MKIIEDFEVVQEGGDLDQDVTSCSHVHVFQILTSVFVSVITPFVTFEL